MKDSKVVMGNLRKKARRGVSLIEVLVVLVLLVLGILIIVRLFPSGFFSINSVGDAALADGLGQAAVSAQAQNTAALPESILPGTLTSLTAANGDYEPDDPNAPSNGYDNARVVTNETITVPAPSGPKRQSIYVVNYGPIVMPVAITAANITDYLRVNSPAWTPLTDNFNDTSNAQPQYPQNAIFPGQSKYMIDYTNGKVAVPYSQNFAQNFMLTVVAYDSVSKTDKTYNITFTVPFSGNTAAPKTAPNQTVDVNATAYPDTTTYYNGGWFDPVGTNTDLVTAKTYKYNVSATPGTPPLPWKSAMLSRAFAPVADNTKFSSDPYEYTLTSANITDGTNPLANLGSIEFNPKGAGRAGSDALKAQISYQAYSWKILHEDRDVAAISGTDTSVSRLTLKNIKRAGDSGPDNVIDTGIIPGSYQSVIVLDLDDGMPVGNQTGGAPDPTAEAGNITDEDLNGTNASTAAINFSFSTGRVTFGSNAFTDNVGGTTPHAHRVRIYYAAEGDWTVAVQKAPSYYTRIADVVSGTDPNILPGQCAYDLTQNVLYFPHSDYGKTVAIDNIVAYDSNGVVLNLLQPGSQSVTIAIGTQNLDQLQTLGGTVKYWSSSALSGIVPSTAKSVTFTVRGLSARAVVAWKERDRWKVHSVDTVLTRAQ